MPKDWVFPYGVGAFLGGLAVGIAGVVENPDSYVATPLIYGLLGLTVVTWLIAYRQKRPPPRRNTA